MSNKTRKQKYNKEYRKRNIKKQKEYAKKWYWKNREKVIKANAKWYKENKEWNLIRTTKNSKNRMIQWSRIIPKKAKCQICGKKLFFNKGNAIDSIHFDHRMGGKEVIAYNPTSWLNSHAVTKINIKTWKSCNFGILCNVCNKQLRTNKRKEWLQKVVKYVFGKDFKITKRI